MRLPQHSRRDRIAVAQLSGTVSRHATQGTPTDEAVAELHSITTDPHLLAHGTLSADDRWFQAARALLAAAGADVEELDRLADEMADGGGTGLDMFASRMNANTWRTGRE